MNLKQINLFRKMVQSDELSLIPSSTNQYLRDRVEYLTETLNDLENRIPTERELELQSNIIDYEYYIKKHEHSLFVCNLADADPCNDLNCIENHKLNIKDAEKELHDIIVKKVSA